MKWDEKESNKRKKLHFKAGKRQLQWDKNKGGAVFVGNLFRSMKKQLLSTSRTEDRSTSRGTVFRQQAGGIVSLFTE